MNNFSGKTYWLIGASDGLGAALATKMAEAGATLILSARRQEALDGVQRGLAGDGHKSVTMDVIDQDSVDRASAEIGSIDGIVYLVGLYDPMSAKEWDTPSAIRMMDANILGAMRVLGAVLPRFVSQDSGHIVLIGSLAAYRGLPAAVGYSTSKAALFSLAETMKIDLKGTGVSTQIINPGFIKTRLTEKNDFNMPQIMTAEVAAGHVFKAMQSGRFATAFPRPFAWFFRAAPLMPNWLYYRFFR